MGLAGRRWIAALVSVLIGSVSDARADEALIAVATNFARTATALSIDFTQQTGHELRFSSGSTGVLHAQITQGAPFDALLSADSATAQRLESEGLGLVGTRFSYATGQLVLWSADQARIGEDGRAALVDPDVRHIAIANPLLAPYGTAARQALERLGLWESVQARIVMAENIGQTQALIATGAAELGFVAASGLVDPALSSPGSRWNVPQEFFDPIVQDALLLQHGRDNEAARSFLAFLRSEPAREIIRRHGYTVD